MGANNWDDEEEGIDSLLEEEGETEVDDLMLEAEKRFDIAKYYKGLLSDSLFEDSSEAAVQVTEEIRRFVRQRMAELLGIRSGSVGGGTFTEDQVDVLSRIADLGPEAPDVLRLVMDKVKRPAPVQDAEVRVAKAPTPAPTLKKRGRPAAQPQPKKTAKPKAKEAATKPDESVLARIHPDYRQDPTLKMEDGKVFVQNKNADGDLLWEKIDGQVRPLYKDITPMAKPVGNIKPMPMPNGSALEATMADLGSRILRETNVEDSVTLRQLGVL